MKVCVLGLGHLGVVTAACLASVGHEVVGLEPTGDAVEALRHGEPPVREPGLEELLAGATWSGDVADAARADVLWLAYDTPVDEQDRADVTAVLERLAAVAPSLRDGMLVVVSSQLPLGTIAGLEERWPALRFACVPENLRLGSAVRDFLRPARIVAGVRDEADRAAIGELLAPLSERIEWMSVESAEASKHALNAFLAASVALTNEIARVCARSGADAKQVERALRSDPRIGPQAYVAPGGPFAGGTLARDVRYLAGLGEPVVLLPAILAANDLHSGWTREALTRAVGALGGRTVAVWGLAYKAESDSLRRSESVALCEWLTEAGTRVRAHDPAVRELAGIEATLCPTALDAATGADALVVATDWPEYRGVAPDDLVALMRRPTVVDPGRLLVDRLGVDHRFRYLAVGAPWPS